MKTPDFAILVSLLCAENAYTTDYDFAKTFSPILVLTEDTGNRWGNIGVIIRPTGRAR